MSASESIEHHASLYGRAAIAALLLGICFALVQARSAYASIVLEILLFVTGSAAIWLSADLFTRLSSTMGTRLGLSPLKTGILIIAIGTSAPEFFSSFAAALAHQPEIVVGNVLGTVVANCLLAIGIAALVAGYTLKVHQDVSGTQMSIFFTGVILSVVGLYDGHLDAFEGILLLILLAFYLYHTITHGGTEPHLVPDDSNEFLITGVSSPVLFVLLLLSLGGLFLSGDYIISSLIEGAELLHFSSAKLATSLLAVGTSIPEIITAIMLVRQNNVDGLFGEIIGSNILDILGILGVISLFTTLSISSSLLLFLTISILLTFAITYVIMHDRQVNRIEGVSLLALYILFIVQLVEL